MRRLARYLGLDRVTVFGIALCVGLSALLLWSAWTIVSRLPAMD